MTLLGIVDAHSVDLAVIASAYVSFIYDPFFLDDNCSLINRMLLKANMKRTTENFSRFCVVLGKIFAKPFARITKLIQNLCLDLSHQIPFCSWCT